MARALQHRPGLLGSGIDPGVIARRMAKTFAIILLALLLLIALALVATQTTFFKSYLRGLVARQASQYLNGTLTIDRLTGSVLTGIELHEVALVHEGRRAVAMKKMTVQYDPITMIRQGLVLMSLTLDDPTVVFERDASGWNFNRFVKTRKSSSRGSPPLTIEALHVNNGHLIVRDQGRLIEDVTSLNTTLRFAYHKPGVEFDVAELSGRATDVNVRRLAGTLQLEGGGVQVGNLAIETDRSHFVTTVNWAGGSEPFAERDLALTLHADRLSLAELGRFYKPVAGIDIEPAIDLRAQGTLTALRMTVHVVSAQGDASGSLIGHFAGAHQGLEGTLDAQNVDLQHIVNRPIWKTRVTGRAQFDWKFGHPTAVGAGPPMRVQFKFAGPQVQGFGYSAQDVRAQGVYVAPDLKFDATGAAYGASGSTRASFHFPASGPMEYTLAGAFKNADMRKLPGNLALPKLATTAAGEYEFKSTGRNWSGSGTLLDSTIEDAHVLPGTVFEIDAQDGVLHYSASGSVETLNPYRFALPFDITWLADDRFRGLVTGKFSFEGSGRTVDSLVLNTTADVTESELAGARVPQAHVTMQMKDRVLASTFSGAFDHLPGTLLATRPELADSLLNGTADTTITISIPAVGPVVLETLKGTTTLNASTVAGLGVDQAEIVGAYDHETASLDRLTVTGSGVQANANGTLALGTTGESNLSYDVTVFDLRPVGERWNQPIAGSAHVVGKATGPASRLILAGTVDANRLMYGTALDALTVSSKVSAEVSNFDVASVRAQSDAQGTFVRIGSISFPRVTAQTKYHDDQLDFTSSLEQDTRSLGLDGLLLIHPDHNEVHLRSLNLAVGQVRWGLPAGKEATAHYTQDTLRIDGLSLQRGEQLISASGTVAIGDASSELPNQLDVRLDNVQVQEINQLLLGDRELGGVLNGTALVRGTRSDPRVDADFSVTGGTVQGVTFESVSGKASYEARSVDLDVRLQQNASAVLTAVGLVPVPNGPGVRSRTDVLDLNLKSTPVDLALLQVVTSQVANLTGQLQADLHLGGTLESPSLNGQLDISNAGFRVPATGVLYRNALARLTFENDRLIVDRFAIGDADNSQLVAIGELGIVKHSLGPMNVQVSAQHFKVLDNQYGHVILDSDLRITGDATRPQVSGTLSTQTGRVEIDQLLEQFTKSPYSTQATVAATPEQTLQPSPAPEAATAPRPSASSLYDAASVDITILLPDNFLLRGRNMQTAYSRIGLGDMNITVGGDLHIRKAPSGEPDLVGTISVVRGSYAFQGRRFEVLRDSQIRFQGLKPIDPALQVGAEREISGVTAIVNIRGTARSPVISLTSQPPMDEADVLSLIVFNQPINQLGEAERLNLAARAGSMAAGYIASPLANSIANALDLDLFEIRPGGGVNGEPSIALGQQIGSRLFVQFRQDFGAEDRSELSFEYRFNQLLRLVSTVAQGGQQLNRTHRIDTTGADLLFVVSY
jgi:TamB, inner membrane protein subunit of TAM complex